MLVAALNRFVDHISSSSTSTRCQTTLCNFSRLLAALHRTHADHLLPLASDASQSAASSPLLPPLVSRVLELAVAVPAPPPAVGVAAPAIACSGVDCVCIDSQRPPDRGTTQRQLRELLRACHPEPAVAADATPAAPVDETRMTPPASADTTGPAPMEVDDIPAPSHQANAAGDGTKKTSSQLPQTNIGSSMELSTAHDGDQRRSSVIAAPAVKMNSDLLAPRTVTLAPPAVVRSASEPTATPAASSRSSSLSSVLPAHAPPSVTPLVACSPSPPAQYSLADQLMKDLQRQTTADLHQQQQAAAAALDTTMAAAEDATGNRTRGGDSGQLPGVAPKSAAVANGCGSEPAMSMSMPTLTVEAERAQQDQDMQSQVEQMLP